MLNQLFKRMAPLVAGVLLLGQLASLHAAFPYITSIQRSGDMVTVYYQDPPPSGYASPRALPDNGYWWIDQNYYGAGSYSVTPGGAWVPFTNAAVYIYPDDNSSDYSYAIHDTVDGVTIWNGP